MGGDFFYAIVGNISDVDPTLGTFRQIDRVDPDAIAHNGFELRKPADDRRGYFRGATAEDDSSALGNGNDLLLV